MITVAWLIQEDLAGLSSSLEVLKAEADQLGNTFFAARVDFDGTMTGVATGSGSFHGQWSLPESHT